MVSTLVQSAPRVQDSLPVRDLVDIVLQQIQLRERDNIMARPKPLPRPIGPDNPFLAEFAGWTKIKTALSKFFREQSHVRHTVAMHTEHSLNLFLTVTGLHENDQIQKIDRRVIRTYREYLLTHIDQPYTTAHDGHRRRSFGYVSADQHLRQLRRFLKFAVSMDYLPANPVDGLLLAPRLVAKNRIRKAAFSPAQLTAIVEALHTAYIQATSGLAASRSESVTKQHACRLEWSMLCLSLIYSGARLSELLNRRREDLQTIDGVLCWSITPRSDAPLKNSMSQRIAPVSSKLQPLLHQFLSCNASTSASPDSYLFPHIRQRGVSVVSRWFSTMLTDLNIKTDKTLTCHSCRHTVAVRLAQAKVFQPLSRRLLGHQASDDVEGKVYLATLTFAAQELSAAIESMNMPDLQTSF